MARHRNIRNAKNLDYDDDDYDYYGSYEDDYGASPGTMEYYSYSARNQRNSLSSYVQDACTIPEEDDSYLLLDEDCIIDNENNETVQNNVNCSESALNDSLIMQSCVELMKETCCNSFSDEDLIEAAKKFDCNAEKALNFLFSNKTQSKCDDVLVDSSGQIESNNATKTMSSQAIPMPQRAPRERNRSRLSKQIQGDSSREFGKPETSNITPSKRNVNISIDIPRSSVLTNSTPKKNDADSSSNNKPSKECQQPETSGAVIKAAEKPPLDSPAQNKLNGTPAKQSKHSINFEAEYQKRCSSASEKQSLSLVVIGHVDAGKSTMMGHLLFKKGVVSKKLIHKYEQESKKLGKSSFAFAWVLDETGEERSRGVTMDIAHNSFETEKYVVQLMDAPGHKDFIPNMITGASQADVAVLVIGSSIGEFESGFGVGGQTREHALLVRTLGVSQLAIAVNKLDTLGWQKSRFDEIKGKLKPFLKQAGYKDSDVKYIPVSGLLGENLVSSPTSAELKEWYKGPSLLEAINNFKVPQRPVNHPLRFTITDVFRGQASGQGGGISIAGRVESGGVAPGTKVVVLPSGERGLVKSITTEMSDYDYALAGEHSTLLLNGVDITKVTTGSFLCDPYNPIPVVTNFQSRIVVFDIEIPITNGFPVELYYKSFSQPAVIRRLIKELHKTTGEVKTKKPRFITKGCTAMIELEVSRSICLEEYKTIKELGRFTLRYGGATIAAGVVTKLLKKN